MLFPQCPFICAFVLGWILKQMMKFFPPSFKSRNFSPERFFFRQEEEAKQSSVGNEERAAFFVCLVSTEMSIIICTIKKKGV